MDIIKYVESKHVKTNLPDVRVGDTVDVGVKVKEGSRERIQTFQGIVISLKGTGTNKSFIVRKTSYNIGVERTFLLNSPNISDIKILKRGKVRRAKLYYLRSRVGKSAKLKERLGVL